MVVVTVERVTSTVTMVVVPVTGGVGDAEQQSTILVSSSGHTIFNRSLMPKSRWFLKCLRICKGAEQHWTPAEERAQNGGGFLAFRETHDWWEIRWKGRFKQVKRVPCS
ncbi:hypothetical protein M8C21_000666 [Ambrosia artemisiifolia]|uniref:Uncharacterized protein n=1 Tax=Ambrosia artemisiifolia TaxID=4212 RepID=A0AAD5D8I4_AMBAR|nr:hypothetical protein M8C21_000666 [Ambrosia artemisiifolia]